MRKLKIILEMIKFEHTIFALPFAVMSAFIAADGLPALAKFGWILVAMVGARSCAMAFNRLADAELDAKNPRTAMRALPAGLITKSTVWGFTIASAGLLVFAAWQLNPLAFALSPVAIAVVMGYSYTKRFTALSHFWLGLSLSISPVGAWIAIQGSFALPPIILCLVVLLWTAGFDIIYACQDVNFDRKHGLHSIPAKIGIRWSLWFSSALHVIAVLLLLGLPLLVELGLFYYIGVGIVVLIFIYEHTIVKPTDLSRVNLAFFTLNGMISLVLMALSITDILFF
ncbi:4-hydroxybenzoate octaprenyltransferase [Candidatus Poribacteria bacterium]|nr:4-hydroxybenzoate octaprenyltransferase [Candidatus Poribacteria bacterium]MYA58417.1 4-hydroxybenzoate octaprenyltransferase [Candidatus Poribacteria bacterium]